MSLHRILIAEGLIEKPQVLLVSTRTFGRDRATMGWMRALTNLKARRLESRDEKKGGKVTIDAIFTEDARAAHAALESQWNTLILNGGGLLQRSYMATRLPLEVGMDLILGLPGTPDGRMTLQGRNIHEILKTNKAKLQQWLDRYLSRR